MTDGDALLQAILSAPEDDVVRLVFADWLEENGRPEFAEFIRVQLARVQCDTPSLRAREQLLLGLNGAQVWQQRREWALPVSVRGTWPLEIGGWEWHRGFPDVWHCSLALWNAHGAQLVNWVPIRRVVLIDREPRPSPAFPRAPERTWLRDEQGWVIRPGGECLLPPELFDLLDSDPLDFSMFTHARVYPTRADAVAALSAACLRFASGVGSV